MKTGKILERGYYFNSLGEKVSIQPELQYAIEHLWMRSFPQSSPRCGGLFCTSAV